jgi:transcriptional regulator with XRE-family HTH domain
MGKSLDLRQQFIRLAKQRMKALGLTQRELAQRLGVQRPYVSRLLSGRHSPRADVMQKVAEALGCEPELKFLLRRR